MAKPARAHDKAQPQAQLDSSAQSVLESAQASQISDVTLARAIARAARETPGVVELSSGLLALAATYGPNERVTGVIVRHSGAHDLIVEVHVIVEMGPALKAETQGRNASVSAHVGAPKVGALPRVADQVREAVYRVARELRLAPPAAVDVLIDDIRFPA